MSNNVQNINKIKTGTCPHGLAPGACPICSMGGGSIKRNAERRNPGEMTYHECAMIGNMMKARALARKNHAKLLEIRLAEQKLFEAKLLHATEKMTLFSKEISNNFLLKPLAFLINKVAIPTIKIIQNIPNIITSITDKLQEIKQKILDVAAKLTAVLGEIKNFIQKKVSEFVSVVKSAFQKLFKVFKRNNTDDEDTKIDDDKKIFNLKKILQKIIKKKDKKDE